MNARLGLSIAALLLASSAAPLYAQRGLKDIPDPDPEVERQSFLVADGFEVNLFAADPLLAKPIQMNFDPQGRLWVVSSEVYPQIAPGQTANDKVLVLEDRDGDGKADATTVFADGLLIPTGIEPGDGGAYVANSTELLHFRDADGDGKADSKRVVLSGFGTEDTHHILHTLRWGHDGFLYFNQSVYIHSSIETPHGVRRLGGGGIWQFRPETMGLEVFVRGFWNSWGHHFDRWGQSFITDGAGGEGINYGLPGASYAATPGATRVLPGLNPGSPKYCGAEFLTGRHVPSDWRGSILTNDFRGNRVCRFVLSEDGAGYAAREQAELIKTKHVAFRPIDVKMGPDGAIYIADWYNPIIQHGEVDFRDPRRDHTRGRIWRVTAKGRPLVTRPKLADATPEHLLALLTAPEQWTRDHAKRVLKERGATAVLPALAARVKELDTREADCDHHRLEALWTYQALDTAEPALLDALLKSTDHRVRAAATRVLSHWLDRLSDPLARLSARVADEHPRVRLEAVRALAKVPQARAVAIALRALDRPMDRFLDYALWLTARDLEPLWLPEVQAARLDLGDAGHLVFALEAVGSPAVVKPLLDALQAGRIPESQQEGALTLIASLGAPSDLAVVFNLAVGDGGLPASRRAALIDALTRESQPGRGRKVKPEGDLTRLGRWLDAPDDALRAASARAAGLWQVQSLRPRLDALAEAADTPDPVRRAAIDALAALGGPESRKALDRLAGLDGSARTRTLALGVLSSLDPAATAPRVVAELAKTDDPAAIDDLLGRLLLRRDGPPALAKALKGQTLPADIAKVAIRAARATGREDAALIDALNRAGGLGPSGAPLSAEQKSQLAADVIRLGDPARGEAVFRRKEAACLKCHAIAGAGGQVGPGLESVGASAPVDYLIDSILEPNKAIKENYNAVAVATADGRVLTGIKVRQTQGELVLRDAEDREVSVPLAAIEERKEAGSLMPAGLADTLTRAELVDLVRFLSELGKIGRYSVGQARVARRWQVLDPAPRSRTAGLLKGSGIDALWQAPPADWAPAYSQVSGVLPSVELRRFEVAASRGPIGFARTELDVSTAGPVLLMLGDGAGLTLWIDGTSVEAQPEVVADLKAGVHTLTIAVDLDRRRDGIGFVLMDVQGSEARAQWVLGK